MEVSFAVPKSLKVFKPTTQLELKQIIVACITIIIEPCHVKHVSCHNYMVCCHVKQVNIGWGNIYIYILSRPFISNSLLKYLVVIDSSFKSLDEMRVFDIYYYNRKSKFLFLYEYLGANEIINVSFIINYLLQWLYHILSNCFSH